MVLRCILKVMQHATPPNAYCCNGAAQRPCNTRQVADLAGIIRRNPRWLFRAEHRRMIAAMIARITAETLQRYFRMNAARP